MRFASERCQVRCFLLMDPNGMVLIVDSALHGTKPCRSSESARAAKSKSGALFAKCVIFLACPAPLPFRHVQFLRVCVITQGTTCHPPVWCCTGTPNPERQGPSVLVLFWFVSLLLFKIRLHFSCKLCLSPPGNQLTTSSRLGRSNVVCGP